MKVKSFNDNEISVMMMALSIFRNHLMERVKEEVDAGNFPPPPPDSGFRFEIFDPKEKVKAIDIPDVMSIVSCSGSMMNEIKKEMFKRQPTLGSMQ